MGISDTLQAIREADLDQELLDELSDALLQIGQISREAMRTVMTACELMIQAQKLNVEVDAAPLVTRAAESCAIQLIESGNWFKGSNEILNLNDLGIGRKICFSEALLQLFCDEFLYTLRSRLSIVERIFLEIKLENLE